MTLITAIATQKFVSFVGDSRGMSTKDGSIVSENLEKIYKVNKKIIIAASGDRVFHDVVIPEISKFDLENVDSCALSLHKVFSNNQTGKQFQLLIGGLNKYNHISYYVVSSSSTENPVPSTPDEKSKVLTATSINENTRKLLPDQILEDMTALAVANDQEYISFNERKAFKIQRRFNKEIAKHDNTVNNYLMQAVIHKL